jgi:hypothetical protein
MPVAGSEVDFRFDGHAASGSRPLLDQSAQARARTPFADKYRFERLRQQIGQLGDVRRDPPCFIAREQFRRRLAAWHH